MLRLLLLSSRQKILPEARQLKGTLWRRELPMNLFATLALSSSSSLRMLLCLLRFGLLISSNSDMWQVMHPWKGTVPSLNTLMTL